MSVVRKIYPADWRALVVTAVDVVTPKGLVRVRFIYDKASDSLFHTIPGRVTFKALGLTGGQVYLLLTKVRKTCLWRIKLTEKAREKRERMEELRAQENDQSAEKKTPIEEQREMPF